MSYESSLKSMLAQRALRQKHVLFAVSSPLHLGQQTPQLPTDNLQQDANVQKVLSCQCQILQNPNSVFKSVY